MLAAAVILPTVCLLWFMNQAVKNERLAVRSKYVDVYKKQFELSRQSRLRDDWVSLNFSLSEAGGILIYNNSGKLTFPVFDDEQIIAPPIFDQAYTHEFQEHSFNQALKEYSRIAEIADSNDIRIMAEISQARCMWRLSRPNEAISKIHTILSHYKGKNIVVRTQKCHAFLLLVEIMYQSKDDQLGSVLEEFYHFATQGMESDNDLQYLGEPDFISHAIPSETQLFALTRFVKYANQLPLDQNISKKIKRANKLIDLLTQSLLTAQSYPTPDFVKSPTIVSSALFRLKTEEPLYGRYRQARNHTRLSVFNQDFFILLLAPLLDDIKTFPAACVIYDADKKVTGTITPNGQLPFIIQPVSDWLPGWSAHLFVEEVTFENFANKQATIYLWSGILVVLLILSAGGIAIRVVSQQIKMNRLKNDFIATVTHELKTPLSSMRLLVDTLREGNYEDEKTVPEYLGLIANENKRLSHLIDSFLTFSRMERNKQVFDFETVSPKDIADAGAEAAQAKLNGGQCEFNMEIEDALPHVRADKDAMVTVLVNLLENACKYSGDNKQIALKVYQENGNICFALKDNGIGIPPRAQKKIFNRFYQVDSRLSRTAEGCGLGLSIVKFIVDAHKGTIDIKSTPEKGSVFTVKLPGI